MKKLAATALALAAALALGFLLAHGRHLFGPRVFRIVDADFRVSSHTPPVCTWVVNETHIVKACWAVRRVSYVVLEDGTRLDSMEFWRRFGISKANVTEVKVLDASRMLSYGYITADFGVKGVERFVKTLYNESFKWAWIDVARIHLWVARGSNCYQFRAFNGTGIAYYLAVFTYDMETNTLKPAPQAMAEVAVRSIEEFYAKPLRLVLGIPVSAIAVNPEEHCTWSEHPTTPNPDEAIRCKNINGATAEKARA